MNALLSKLRGTELPLYFWLLGFVEFCLRTTVAPGLPALGWPTLLATCALAAGLEAAHGARWARAAREILDCARGRPVLAFCLFLLGAELALGFFSSLKPPHLSQEFDAINYQMALPRQHLIQGTPGWISWSIADLWPMALQWGLAPVSYVFSTVNKLPQFVLTLGLVPCLYRLGQRLAPRADPLTQLMPTLAFFAGHGVMIQVGTAMMDLPALYLLALGLLAFLEKRYVVAALALAVYVASKAFYPFQIGAAVVGGLTWAMAGRAELRPALTRFVPWLTVFSLLLLARPAIVSWNATGTPLFPFLTCRFAEGEYCAPDKRAILDDSARGMLAVRTSYGSGDGPAAFARHLWRVAVPTQGVNNEFDYPLGLPWLLFLTLLAFHLAAGGWRNPVTLLALLFWALWWANAHQSRWLYPTLAFGFLATMAEQARARKVLPTLIALSFLLSLASQVRAMRPTIFVTNVEIQARQAAKILYTPDGKLANSELLYVEKPVLDHAPDNHYWVLR